MTLPSDTSKPDIRIQNITSETEKIKLERIADRDFVETDVYLDGREFVNCIFKNCRLFIKLGVFRITGPRIHLEHCEFVALPPAAGVKALFDLLALQPIQR